MSTQLNRTINAIVIHTQSFTNIIQMELANTSFGKNLPMELILDMVKTIMKQELEKLSVSFSLSEPGSVAKTALTAKTSVTLPASNKGKQITLLSKPLYKSSIGGR
ncbi:MAG: hypothetical protein ACYDEJ_08660 [Desulfitobacteriaceae bacterium]